jgi:GT2 family glycosyltransferase
MYANKQVLIIVLNYNGYRDTIACLDSLLGLDCSCHHILLIDNASSDASVAEITGWAEDKFVTRVVPDGSRATEICKNLLSPPPTPADAGKPLLTVLVNQENEGFAAGCNQGIKIALAARLEYVWLLNNDTVADPHALSLLVDFLQQNSSCQVVVPQIRYYDRPEVVWNCGGDLKWYGARKYKYVNQPVAALPARPSLDVTFVTGCALLIRCALLEKYGGLSEQFFFGEEDFEFCLRMKKHRVRMSCCLDSVIYHKVGSSVNKASKKAVNKVYVHYLNRFINLRKYWPLALWQPWRFCYGIFIYNLLGRRYQISRRHRILFLRNLMRDSASMDGVDRRRFFAIMNDADFISNL